ncbi:hypothetical protein C8R44DRAFT_893152 [Mycena epipterygia]|nr:hypothetical protein C8R44DRAFT_893152 [Mycena epipterygia]
MSCPSLHSRRILPSIFIVYRMASCPPLPVPHIMNSIPHPILFIRSRRPPSFTSGRTTTTTVPYFSSPSLSHSQHLSQECRIGPLHYHPFPSHPSSASLWRPCLIAVLHVASHPFLPILHVPRPLHSTSLPRLIAVHCPQLPQLQVVQIKIKKLTGELCAVLPLVPCTRYPCARPLSAVCAVRALYPPAWLRSFFAHATLLFLSPSISFPPAPSSIPPRAHPPSRKFSARTSARPRVVHLLFASPRFRRANSQSLLRISPSLPSIYTFLPSLYSPPILLSEDVASKGDACQGVV